MGFRPETAFMQRRGSPQEVVLALGRAAQRALLIHVRQRPHTAVMQAKFKRPLTRAAGLKIPSLGTW